MINKNDLRKAISSIAISNAKRNTIYKAFSDLDSITKEEFDSVKSDISKVVESMLTKDTVGKANGVASLDSNGSVPIEQLGNIDTTLFLIVRELPTDDIKSNKIYLVPNEDGQGNNVYVEYLYVENVWEKVGEFKPEVDLSHIEKELDTKADLNKVGYVEVEQLTPAVTYNKKNNNIIGTFKVDELDKLNNIVKNNNPANGWQYYDFDDMLDDDVVPQYIYDATADEHIEITATTYTDIDDEHNGDAFNTAKPLDLTHDLYLDNERIGMKSRITKTNTIDCIKNSIILGMSSINSSDETNVEHNIIFETNRWQSNNFKSKNSIIFTVGENTSLWGNTNVTNNVILSTGGDKIDKSNCILIGHCENKDLSDYSILIGENSYAYSQCVTVGHNCKNKNGIVYGLDVHGGISSVSIGRNINSSLYPSELGMYTVSIGYNIKSSTKSVAVGTLTSTNGENSIAIGYEAQCYGKFSISIGSTTASKLVTNPSIKIGKFVNPSATNDYGYYYIGGYKDDKTFYNIEETLTYNNQHKKYIYGIGGYDGTNSDAEGVKSLQEVLADKADVSDYYTKTEIDGKGYLTTHQSLDNCVKIGNDTTPTQLFKGQGSATINAKQLLLNSPSGGVNIQPDSINIGSSSFTFKANPTEGLGFIVNTASKGVILTPQGGVNSIGFNAKDAIVQKGGSLVGQDVAGAVYNVNGNFVNLNPLYNLESKFRDTIAIHVALDNITDASTPEEVVTKFNQLLKSLKAIGLMKPDATAE